MDSFSCDLESFYYVSNGRMRNGRKNRSLVLHLPGILFCAFFGWEGSMGEEEKSYSQSSRKKRRGKRFFFLLSRHGPLQNFSFTYDHVANCSSWKKSRDFVISLSPLFAPSYLQQKGSESILELALRLIHCCWSGTYSSAGIASRIWLTGESGLRSLSSSEEKCHLQS